MHRPDPSRRPLSPDWQAAVRALQERTTLDRPGTDPRTGRPEGDAPDPYAHTSELRALVARLKGERLRRGLNLADVARATGQARSAISRLENGQYPNPTLNTVYRYARALGMRVTLSAEPLPDGHAEHIQQHVEAVGRFPFTSTGGG